MLIPNDIKQVYGKLNITNGTFQRKQKIAHLTHKIDLKCD